MPEVPGDVSPVPPLDAPSVPDRLSVPELVIGPPENDKPLSDVEASTLVTVPEPPPEAEMRMLPVAALTVIPEPAVTLVTPVFVIITEPVVGLTEIPAPEPLTLLTAPPPDGA